MNYCYLGFHQWGKWEKKDYVYYPRNGFFGGIDKSVSGIQSCQIRRCLKCGKYEEEEL